MKVEPKSFADFLRERLRASAKRRGVSAPTDETRVIEAGVIDSMGFLELVTDLEEKFAIRIDFSSVDPERFTTINGLADIASKAGDGK